jgi:hypothetical protein
LSLIDVWKIDRWETRLEYNALVAQALFSGGATLQQNVKYNLFYYILASSNASIRVPNNNQTYVTTKNF